MGIKRKISSIYLTEIAARYNGMPDRLTPGQAWETSRSGWRINQLAGAAIATEPAGNTASQLGRGRHLMRDHFAQEADQGTGQGHDLTHQRPIVGVVDVQQPPILFPPVGVKIRHDRHNPAGTSTKGIQMDPIEVAGFVDGVMGLQVEQAQKQLPIDLLAQLCHELKVFSLGRGCPFQPTDFIAANGFIPLTLLYGTDTGFAELILFMIAQHFRPKLFTELRVKVVGNNGPTLAHQTFDNKAVVVCRNMTSYRKFG